jgi:hypothetical protein
MLDNGFSLDDYNWLERAAFRESDRSFLLQPEPGQVFNPVGRGFFLALFCLGGTDPLPYRLAILALHALQVCLLYLVVERIFLRRGLALAAAFLFAVERSYDEALFWIAAFFHPLNAVFCLAALLAWLIFLETGARVARLAALLAFGAALLTKAPAFTFALLFPAALLVVGDRRPRSWRSLLPFATVWAAAGVVNLALGLEHSYLLERGYYQFGWHVVPNLAHYLAWMVLPFAAVAERLGVGELYRALMAVARVAAPIATVVVLVRAGARTRLFVGWGLLALLPFLPFTFEPVSRYTYLAAAGFAAVVACVALAFGERLQPSARRGAAVAAGLLLALVALADTIVVDHDYEYRERMEVGLIGDVQRALPELPTDRTVRIAGLPRFGIDPGIHLQAALRLAYDEPGLRLEIVSPAEMTGAQDMLRFEEGRILPARGPVR